MKASHSTTIPSCNYFEWKILQDENFMEAKPTGYSPCCGEAYLLPSTSSSLECVWRLTMEKKIQIWGDKWLSTPSSFKIQSPPKILSKHATVKELLTTNGSWNISLILEIFWDEEGKTIQNIPLRKNIQEDKLIWALTKNGKFTVKSVYFFAMQSKLDSKGSPSNTSDINWKRIWSLSVLENVKNVLWRAHNNSLPTKASLHYR